MILRSVTKHVKDQNWFAVILDLAIVVFGVFIGIQVSNWNEKRTQEEVTTVLIKRLSDDIDREHQVITVDLRNQNELRTEIYLEYIRGIIPFEIQQMILNECSDVPIPVAQSFGAILPETCNLQLPDEIFSKAATLLRSQPNLLKNLQFQLAANERYVNNMIQMGEENRKLTCDTRML